MRGPGNTFRHPKARAPETTSLHPVHMLLFALCIAMGGAACAAISAKGIANLAQFNLTHIDRGAW